MEFSAVQVTGTYSLRSTINPDKYYGSVNSEDPEMITFPPLYVPAQIIRSSPEVLKKNSIFLTVEILFQILPTIIFPDRVRINRCCCAMTIITTNTSVVYHK